MTTPLYFSYQWRTGEDPAKARRLYPSRAADPPGDRSVTVPWNHTGADPEGMVAASPTAVKWTFLFGPCLFVCKSHIRVKGLQPSCSTHIRVWEAKVIDGKDTRVFTRESPEPLVADKESSNTHIDGMWIGWLADGHRARIEIDYWGAAEDDDYGLIMAGGVNGIYWRPESGTGSPDPAVAYDTPEFDAAVARSLDRLALKSQLQRP